MNPTTFEGALHHLREIARIDTLTGDEVLDSTNVDSLDLLEWIADLGIDIETLADDSKLMEHVAKMTIREIYDALTDLVPGDPLAAEV